MGQRRNGKRYQIATEQSKEQRDPSYGYSLKANEKTGR